MLLENKNAVIYGAGGAVGSAIARAFAREGARVFLTARSLRKLDSVAQDIARDGGTPEIAQVDALDERAVEKHLDAVVAKAGTIDISFNAIGIPQEGAQGAPLVELSLDKFLLPITTYTRAHFLTARAAARRMAKVRSGVVMMHTPQPARQGTPLVGGMGPMWAALESLCRGLSAELASQGVRAVCLRSTGIPETATIDVVFGQHARTLGISREEFGKMIDGKSHAQRSTTLSELANVAAFVASDRATALTGTVVNLSLGSVVD